MTSAEFHQLYAPHIKLQRSMVAELQHYADKHPLGIEAPSTVDRQTGLRVGVGDHWDRHAQHLLVCHEVETRTPVDRP